MKRKAVKDLTEAELGRVAIELDTKLQQAISDELHEEAQELAEYFYQQCVGYVKLTPEQQEKLETLLSTHGLAVGTFALKAYMDGLSARVPPTLPTTSGSDPQQRPQA